MKRNEKQKSLSCEMKIRSVMTFKEKNENLYQEELDSIKKATKNRNSRNIQRFILIDRQVK